MNARKMLIVDDDDYFRKTLKKIMEQNSYVVEEATNGEQAKEILKINKFDLVISDIQMPFFTGIELLEWSKKNHPVPIVLITGFTQLLDVKSAYELGAAGFLMKPFDEAALIDELKKINFSNNPKQIVEPAFLNKLIPAEEYCKISINDFASGSKIGFSIYLKLSESKYLKIAHSGQDITLEKIKSYKGKGLDYLYVTMADYRKLVGFNLKLAGAASNKNIDVTTKLKFLKYTGETIAQNLFVTDLNQSAFSDSKDFVQIALNVISEDPSALLMLEVLNSHADFLYAHALGVSIYGVMIAKLIGWDSPQTIFKISLAGLYHDIGKKEIARAILEKPRPLMTVEERKVYETHPARGKEILDLLKSFPSDVIDITYQHHENNLGTGFPRFLKKASIHPLASLLAAANKFCELVVKSPVSEGMSAREAISQMEGKFPGEFGVEYLSALKKLIA
jgi:response regulator RpfG family c-di-GMP phosphodiesterase